MTEQPVVLHCHSQHSFLDGMSSVKEMVSRAKELGMDALALTNHGNIFGVVEFYKECKKQGIKPILGMEVYLTPDHELKERHAYHLVLLAETDEGFQNLVRLTTLANKNFYFKPRVDFKDLAGNSKGLIACTACMHGPIAYQLYDKMSWPKEGEESQLKEAANIPKAYQYTKDLLRIFGTSNLFLEVQDGGIPEQKIINQRIRELAQEFGLQTVATQDFHYVIKSDAKPHSFLKAMAFGKFAVEEGSHGFSTDEFYIKSREEWLTNSDLLPEEVDRTREIAARCNTSLTLNKMRLPKYEIEDGRSSIEVLRGRLRLGWIDRKLKTEQNYIDRLNHELKDIESAGLADYFLIISDIVSYCRANDIALGPGRGSAGGSLVSYLLGITNLDPVKYDLIWERFYNAGRKGSMPDIDTDIEKSRRDEVITYIRSRFGEDRVAQIVTFSSLGAKQVLRDVFNVAGIDENTKNIIAGMVPAKNEDHGSISLLEAIEAVPKLKEYSENEESFTIERDGRVVRTTSWKELFSIALRLEGCYKTSGVHAAGVVIADDDFSIAGVPLVRAKNKEELICGWDMDTVDALGFMKLDMLGLATLDVIKTTLALVEQRHGIKVDINSVPLNDNKVFDLLCNGHNQGIFQLETNLGKSWSKKTKPRSLEEIADLVSIIRPATLDTGLADTYVKRKHGVEEVTFLHEKLKPILSQTNGVLVFQEQMMAIANHICGWDLKDCDNLRKVVGKKKPDELRSFEERFVNDATKSVGKDNAIEIWRWIEKAGGYGFNRSHAMGYSLLAYQTAWLKANYYIEFLCANLMHAKDKANQQRTPQDVIASFINDARLHEVDVIPPNLSKSQIDFSIMNDHTISFGFSHIKGVGQAAMKAVELCKVANNFSEFISLASQSSMNKGVVEALIASGALDDFRLTRRSMRAQYMLLNSLTEKEVGMLDGCLGGSIDERIVTLADETTVEFRKKNKVKMPNVNRRSILRDLVDKYRQESHKDSVVQILAWEKQYLGTTLSGSMADLNRAVSGARHNCLQVAGHELPNGTNVDLCVVLEDVREVTVKKGKTQGRQMAFLVVSDSTYTLDGSCAFPDLYDRMRNDGIMTGDIISIQGKISDRGLIINKVRQL